MMTLEKTSKPAIQSSELRIIILTLLSNVLIYLLTDDQFIELVGQKLYMFNTASLILVGFLRKYKTEEAIEGWFKSKPKTDPVAEALDKENDLY